MQFLTSSVWLDTLTETLHAHFSFCPLRSCSLFRCSPLQSCVTSPHQAPNTHCHTTHCTTVKRGFKECACFYRPLLEMLRPSLCPPPLKRYPVLLFICFSSPLPLRAHQSTLCDLMCSPPPLYLWGKLLKTKGTQHREVGFLEHY